MLASAARSRSASRRRIGGSRTATARCAASTTAACSARASASRARRSAGSTARTRSFTTARRQRSSGRSAATAARPFRPSRTTSVTGTFRPAFWTAIPALGRALTSSPHRGRRSPSSTTFCRGTRLIRRGSHLPIVETPRVHDASAARRRQLSLRQRRVRGDGSPAPRRELLLLVVSPQPSRGVQQHAARAARRVSLGREARSESRSYALPAPATAMDGGSAANAGAICGRQYATEFCADCGSPVPSAAPGSPIGHAAGRRDRHAARRGYRPCIFTSARRRRGTTSADAWPAVRRAAAAGAVH